MKKLLFVSVCLLICLATASAQQGQGNRGGGQGRTPEETAKRNTEMMKDSLKLNARQVVRVDSINLVYAKAQAKLRENANGDFASIREDMTKLNEKQLKDFEKVLTKDQLAKYQKMMEARRNRMGQGGGQGGGGNRPARNN